MKRTCALCIEGIDGAGKDVQCGILVRALKKRGFKVQVYRFPKKNTTCGKIIDAIVHGTAVYSPREEFHYFLCNIVGGIRKLREEKRKRKNGKRRVVLFNRYVFSTIAYQCARGLPLTEAKKRIREGIRAGDIIVPDIVFLLDLPVSEAMKRIARRKTRKSVFERAAYLEKVRQLYSRLYHEQFLTRWIKIDASKSKKEIAEQIRAYLQIW